MIAFKVAGVLDILWQRYSRRMWLIIGSLHYFVDIAAHNGSFLHGNHWERASYMYHPFSTI